MNVFAITVLSVLVLFLFIATIVMTIKHAVASQYVRWLWNECQRSKMMYLESDKFSAQEKLVEAQRFEELDFITQRAFVNIIKKERES